MARANTRKQSSLALGERVARLEGKVSVLTRLNCVELSVLVMVLIALLMRS